jgi:hypothetical protein
LLAGPEVTSPSSERTRVAYWTHGLAKSCSPRPNLSVAAAPRVDSIRVGHTWQRAVDVAKHSGHPASVEVLDRAIAGEVLVEIGFDLLDTRVQVHR